MNKKGIALDDLLPLIFLLLAILLLLIILGPGTSERANQKYVELQVKHRGQVLLHEYMQATIEYNGQPMNMVHFLTTVKDDNQKKEAFKKHATTFFTERWREGCWEAQLRSDTDNNRPDPSLDAASAGTRDLKNCMDNANYRFDGSFPLPHDEKPLQLRVSIAK